MVRGGLISCWLWLAALCAACGGTTAEGHAGSGGEGEPPNACEDDPCQNGATCIEDGASFRCECQPGYSGETCAELVAGLSARPPNPSCIAPERALGSTGPLSWERVPWLGAGATLMQIRQAPDGSWYEIYRNGDVLRASAEGIREPSPLLTISDIDTSGELGLLGFDFHPDYPSAPFVFFYYATNAADPFLRIERYSTTAASDLPGTETFVAGSAKEILTIDKGNTALNHNGGSIEFSPSEAGAVLYLATGDGGSNSMSAQDPQSLLGKVLRIDVTDSDAVSYTPEVVALGLRNPFRWAFDSQTGDIWIGDVGQGAYEEIDFLPARGPSNPLPNFGWPYMEGFHCYRFPSADVANDCDSPVALTLPLHEYDHDVGIAIVGGRPYRGAEIRALSGRYFFADYAPRSGVGNWLLEPNPSEDPDVPDDDFLRVPVTPPASGMAGYAEDNDGELYVFNPSGTVYKLAANDQPPPPEPVPAALVDTGCFDVSGNPSTPLVPYEPRAPLWSDGATKKRWMALPDGQVVELDERGDFRFPIGTVLAKEFTLEGVRVETRLLMRHPDGGWGGYSYAWIDAEGRPLTDGELLTDEDEVTRSVPGTTRTWTYPSRGQCFQCHTSAAGIALGAETLQLNGMLEYPSTGLTGHQMFTLQQIGVFAPTDSVDLEPALPSYDDAVTPLVDRVWSYFHSNCANCHQPGASGYEGRSAMPDLRYDAEADRSGIHPLEAALCNVEATAEDLGLGAGALLVTPGLPGDWSDLSAGGSVLYLRMAARPNVPSSSGAMPPVGSQIVDRDGGLALVRDWIRGLRCP